MRWWGRSIEWILFTVVVGGALFGFAVIISNAVAFLVASVMTTVASGGYLFFQVQRMITETVEETV